MKARMSPATARQNLPAGTQEAVRAMVDAEFAERQKIYANRILLALCLALNDIAGFGDKRLMYILQGIEDITTDYAERAGKNYRPETAEEDKVAQMMQELRKSPRRVRRLPVLPRQPELQDRRNPDVVGQRFRT